MLRLRKGKILIPKIKQDLIQILKQRSLRALTLQGAIEKRLILLS